MKSATKTLSTVAVMFAVAVMVLAMIAAPIGPSLLTASGSVANNTTPPNSPEAEKPPIGPRVRLQPTITSSAEECVRGVVSEFPCVSLRSHSVGPTPFHHSWIVITDENGNEKLYRGGGYIRKECKGFDIFIKGEYGVYKPWSTDWDPTARDMVLMYGPEARGLDKTLEGIIDNRLNSLRPCQSYHFEGPNSNTVVYTILTLAGLQDKADSAFKSFCNKRTLTGPNCHAWNNQDLIRLLSTGQPTNTTNNVPSACQPIVEQIDRLKARLKSVQEKLQSAPSGQKGDLIEQIEFLNGQIATKEAELKQCIANNRPEAGAANATNATGATTTGSTSSSASSTLQGPGIVGPEPFIPQTEPTERRTNTTTAGGTQEGPGDLVAGGPIKSFAPGQNGQCQAPSKLEGNQCVLPGDPWFYYPKEHIPNIKIAPNNDTIYAAPDGQSGLICPSLNITRSPLSSDRPGDTITPHQIACNMLALPDGALVIGIDPNSFGAAPGSTTTPTTTTGPGNGTGTGTTTRPGGPQPPGTTPPGGGQQPGGQQPSGPSTGGGGGAAAPKPKDPSGTTGGGGEPSSPGPGGPAAGAAGAAAGKANSPLGSLITTFAPGPNGQCPAPSKLQGGNCVLPAEWRYFSKDQKTGISIAGNGDITKTVPGLASPVVICPAFQFPRSPLSSDRPGDLIPSLPLSCKILDTPDGGVVVGFDASAFDPSTLPPGALPPPPGQQPVACPDGHVVVPGCLALPPIPGQPVTPPISGTGTGGGAAGGQPPGGPGPGQPPGGPTQPPTTPPPGGPGQQPAPGGPSPPGWEPGKKGPFGGLIREDGWIYFDGIKCPKGITDPSHPSCRMIQFIRTDDDGTNWFDFTPDATPEVPARLQCDPGVQDTSSEKCRLVDQSSAGTKPPAPPGPTNTTDPGQRPAPPAPPGPVEPPVDPTLPPGPTNTTDPTLPPPQGPTTDPTLPPGPVPDGICTPDDDPDDDNNPWDPESPNYDPDCQEPAPPIVPDPDSCAFGTVFDEDVEEGEDPCVPCPTDPEDELFDEEQCGEPIDTSTQAPEEFDEEEEDLTAQQPDQGAEAEQFEEFEEEE
jgi:hypothetical protein